MRRLRKRESFGLSLPEFESDDERRLESGCLPRRRLIEPRRDDGNLREGFFVECLLERIASRDEVFANEPLERRVH